MGIRLVVGLGNPGKEYERTRHNAGFWLVERFAQASGVVLRKDQKFKALVGKTAAGVWLLQPQTFMNLSGQPVHMQSPLVPAILLLVSLASVELGDHHKKVLWRSAVVSLVMLAVGILLGAIPWS